MAKKIILAVAASLVLGILGGGAAALLLRDSPKQEKAEEDFSGVRTVVWTADRSDLENFIDGGRFTLELFLRRSRPDWLEYDLSSRGREAVLTLSFSFQSQEEYEERFQEMAAAEPGISWSGEEEMVLMEGCPASRLLEFLQSQLMEADCLKERQLSGLFDVAENGITLNGREYQTQTECLLSAKNSHGPEKLEELAIDTSEEKDGSLNRQITLVRRGKEHTEEFEARNLEELARKTMECLEVPVSIFEEQQWLKESRVSVRRQEWIDLEHLMEEGGSFQYRYEYPQEYGEVVPAGEGIRVEENRVIGENAAQIAFDYERNFNFTLVEIETDLSRISGVVSRTILLKLPLQVALRMEEELKEDLTGRLIPGSVMQIYDEGGQRCFEIQFSSGRMKDISRFTSAVLGDSCRLDCEQSWFPWQNTKLEEHISLPHVLGEDSAPGLVRVRYLLPPLHRLETDVEEEKQGEELFFLMGSRGNLQLEYESFSLWRAVLWGIGLAAVLMALTRAARLLKRL